MLVECVACHKKYNPLFHNGHCPNEANHSKLQNRDMLESQCHACQHTWARHGAGHPHECFVDHCECRAFVGDNVPHTVPAGSFEEFALMVHQLVEKQLTNRRVKSEDAMRIVNDAYDMALLKVSRPTTNIGKNKESA